MGSSLLLWFVYSLVIGAFCALLAPRAVAPGAPFPVVFCEVGLIAFLGYSAALWQSSIWYKRSWLTTAKFTFDGAIYASLTAVCFAWLWPAAG
jgi:hypothetical protein